MLLSLRLAVEDIFDRRNTVKFNKVEESPSFTTKWFTGVALQRWLYVKKTATWAEANTSYFANPQFMYAYSNTRINL